MVDAAASVPPGHNGRTRRTLRFFVLGRTCEVGASEGSSGTLKAGCCCVHRLYCITGNKILRAIVTNGEVGQGVDVHATWRVGSDL